MTLVWLVIWLIANNVGGSEPLTADPVNGWLAWLIVAIAIDINRPPGLVPGARKAAE